MLYKMELLVTYVAICYVLIFSHRGIPLFELLLYCKLKYVRLLIYGNHIILDT